jgi:hypothetical protein
MIMDLEILWEKAEHGMVRSKVKVLGRVSHHARSSCIVIERGGSSGNRLN